MKFLVAGVMAILFTAAVTNAAERSPLDWGQELFNDPGLGGSTNPLSCGSCHAGGAGLEHASNVRKMVNICLVDRMGGSFSDPSVNWRALMDYVRTLSSR